MDRRDFIILGAAGASSTFAGVGCQKGTVTDAPETQERDDVAWDKAPCRFCGTGCGVEVGVADGKVVAVRGDELNPVNKEFLFWLTTGRVLEHWHSGSMTRRIKHLHQAVPEAYVELNRADAVELGIADNDRVKLVSRRGELHLRVKIDERGRPPRGTVFVPFFDEGKLVNRLTLDAMDNISKEPDYKKCAVRLEKV